MKSNVHNLYTQIFVALVCFSTFIAGANEVLEQTSLFPRTGSEYRASTPDEMAERAKRFPNRKALLMRPVDRELLEYGNGGKWKTFSDDHIEFEIPDHPSLKVNVQTPDEEPQLNVVGGVVTTVDNSFARVYELTYGNRQPYGLVLVTESDWFDEGICMCGPIAAKFYVSTEGNLIETSHLPGGNIKKFQVINGTHRAILFEWTHSAITQEAYARIGSSIRLKPKATRTDAEWFALTKEKRPEWDGRGWLRAGDSMERAIELIGEPTNRTKSELEWSKEGRDSFGGGTRRILRLHFEEGRLVPFRENWQEYGELDPLVGSVEWAKALVEEWEKSFEKAEEKKLSWKAPAEAVSEVFEAFKKEAPTATGELWNHWCMVLWELAGIGERNEEAIAIVKARFLERDSNQHYARWALDEYDVPELADLVSNWIEFIFRIDDEEDARISEISNLLSSLEKDDPRRQEFIRRGLAHTNAAIRGKAVYRARTLPEQEAKEAIRMALSDPDEDVRRYASYSIGRVFSADDRESLKAIAANEANANLKKSLEEKIAALK